MTDEIQLASLYDSPETFVCSGYGCVGNLSGTYFDTLQRVLTGISKGGSLHVPEVVVDNTFNSGVALMSENTVQHKSFLPSLTMYDKILGGK